MMKTLGFTIFGDPDTNSRPRAVSINGRARVYQEKKNWHYAIIQEAKLLQDHLQGPYEINIICEFRRPKTHFNKKGLKENAPFYCEKKPDNDNIEKTVFDALVKSGIIDDDAQIAKNSTIKVYSADPKTTIIMKELT
jgi:Holliday junction resolvase RusA-like endonuclease